MTRIPVPAEYLAASAERPNARAARLTERLTRLYGATAYSPNLFATPLGPISFRGRERFIPRFINITPRSVEESLRVAIYAGFDHRDERSTDAVLHLVDVLLVSPDLADGLNLTLFPLVDVGGIHGDTTARSLADEDWRRSGQPEIEQLAREARHRAHHCVVRIATAAEGEGDDLVVVGLRGHGRHDFGAYSDEFLSSADFDPFPVRFETDTREPAEGPLSIADDLPYSPVELTLTLPHNWPAELYREAVAHIARSLLFRYRRHQSYGQHI